jgi:hypothetical protein
MLLMVRALYASTRTKMATRGHPGIRCHHGRRSSGAWSGVPAEETLDAFAAAFATIGYVLCAGPEREAGFEKIAVYALASGAPTHAARQLTCPAESRTKG